MLALTVAAVTACEPFPLCDPLSKPMAKTAPDLFSVAWSVRGPPFSSPAEVIEVHVNRSWYKAGADRFWNLARLGFFDDTRFFRVLPGFVVQFGLSGDPRIASRYCDDNKCPLNPPYGAPIPPADPSESHKSNLRGFVSYSLMDGSVNASTEIFINLANNSRLDSLNFLPFGFVSRSSMQMVDKLYSGYGELNESDICPHGNSSHGVPCNGPQIRRMVQEGNAYLEKDFPKMNYIVNTSTTSDLHRL